MPQIVTFHIQDGRGDAWEYFRTVDADCTIWNKRTGECQRFLFDTDEPWTNGFYNKPDMSNDVIRNLVENNIRSNLVALTIEHQGKPVDGFTDAQIQSDIEITAYWCVAWGIPADRDHLILHSDLDSVNRSRCPGSEFPIDFIISEVRKLVNQIIPPPSPGTGDEPLFINGFYISFGFKDKFLEHGRIENPGDPVNGGIKFFGLPLSNEFQQNGVTRQIFERHVLEYNGAAPDDWKITGAQAGRLWLATLER